MFTIVFLHPNNHKIIAFENCKEITFVDLPLLIGEGI